MQAMLLFRSDYDKIKTVFLFDLGGELDQKYLIELLFITCENFYL